MLIADEGMLVVLDAARFVPIRTCLLGAAVIFCHRPRMRERMVDQRDFVMEDIPVGLIAINPLLDDGLIVLMQRKPGAVQGARTFETASLDGEHVITAPCMRTIKPSS